MGLAEEQKAKIRLILLEQQRQVHALGEDESLTNAAWASEVWKVHLRTVAQVKLQMTDAQITKYAKDEAKRKKSDAGNDDGDYGPRMEGRRDRRRVVGEGQAGEGLRGSDTGVAWAKKG